MTNHTVDMGEFMDFVHDVDHSVITPDPELARHIGRQEGKRMVFTNGSRKHAEKVIDRLGLNGLFHDLYDIEAGEFLPKPHRESFERFTRHFGIMATARSCSKTPRAILKPPPAGLYHRLVRADEHDPHGESAGPGDHPDHVHYAVDCLRSFLARVR
jgi:putative hydrolase of the HAD superfamily